MRLRPKALRLVLLTFAGAVMTLSAAPDVQARTLSSDRLRFLGPAAAVSAVSGDAQSQAVGKPFDANLVVAVVDAGGTAVGANVLVTFTAPSGSGVATAVLPGTANTDSNGQVSLSAVAGTVSGSYSIIASVPGASGATFGLTNTPGPAAQVAALSGNAQGQDVTRAFANPLVAQVTDVYGNAVGANVTVNWAIPATTATATLAPNPGVTDANGQVSVVATANQRPGTYSVAASVGGGIHGAHFALTNLVGPVVSITAVSGGNQSVLRGTSFPLPLVAKIVDAQGNPVPGVIVQFSSDGVPLSANATLSDSQGMVSVSAQASAVSGTHGAYALVGAVRPYATFLLTSQTGPAASLQVIAGNDQNTTVAQPFLPVVVRVDDDPAGQGNPIVGAVVTVSGAASGASASLAATPGPTDGNGQTVLTLDANAVAGSYTLKLSSASLSADLRLSNRVDVPAQIVSRVSAPILINIVTGGPIPVHVTDAYGNPIAGCQPLVIVAPSTGPTVYNGLNFPPRVTDANGDLDMPTYPNNLLGPYTARVAVGLAYADLALCNVVGPPATLNVLSGGNQTTPVHAVFAAPIVVQAFDAYGYASSNATLTFAGPQGSASMVPNTTQVVTDANGLASISPIASDVAGSYVVSVYVRPDYGPNIPVRLTNAAGPLAHLTVLSGNAQSARVGNPFAATLVLQLTDTYGNGVPGANVTFTAPSSGASALLGDSSEISDAQGQVSTSASANTLTGTYSIIASVGGMSATWTLTNSAAPAANLAVRTGDNQSVALNSALAGPLVVQVTDTYGNPTANVSVSFTPPSSGASLVSTPTPFTTTTNVGGLAGFLGSANGTLGTYSVAAAAAGVTPTVAFTVSNVASGSLSLTKISGDNQSTQVATSFAQPLVLQVHDAANNPIAGAPVTFAAASMDVRLSTPSASSDANGLVRVNVSAPTYPGPLQVYAAIAGVSAAFTLQVTPGPVVALQADANAIVQAATGGQPFAKALAVVALDAWNNPVCCTAVNFVAPARGASAQLSAASLATDANGRAQITAVAGSVLGSYPVSVSLAGSGSGSSASAAACTATFTLTNLAGVSALLRVVAGDGATATVHQAFAQPWQVQLVDASGAPLPGVAVSFAAPSGNSTVPFFQATASLSAAVVRTDAQGMAQVQATANDHQGGYQVTVSAVGSSAPVLLNLYNRADVPVSIAVDPTTTPQTAGVGTDFALSLQAQIGDAYGNPVASTLVNLSSPASGARPRLGSNQDTADSNGVVYVLAAAGTVAGTYQVRGQVAGVAAPAVWVLTNTDPGDAPRVLSTPSPLNQSTPVGNAFAALQVSVQDSFGGPVPGAEVDFTGPSSGPGAVFAAALTADANGRVTLPITANAQAGSYTVQATVARGRTPLVFSLRNTAAPASQLLLNAGSTPQSALLGHPYGASLTARVLDAFNNPLQGATVHFNAPGSEPTVQLSAAAVITDAQGAAQAVAIAGGTAGLVTVSVSVAGTALTGSLELTNMPAGPDTLLLQSGNNQSAIAGEAFAAALSFTLHSADGLAHAGVPVSFAAAPAGLILSTAQANTDAAGAVQVQVSAGASGTFTVTASAPNTAAPASATLTVTSVPTQTVLTLSKAILDPGQSAQLQATVSGKRPPRGTVDFYLDGARLSSMPLDAAGQASITRVAPNPGAHSVTAVLLPEAPFGASQADPAVLTVTDWVISGGGCSSLGVGVPWFLAWMASRVLVRAARRRA